MDEAQVDEVESLHDDITEAEEQEEGIQQRDGTHEPAAQAWVEEHLQRFVPALRNMGFEPFAIIVTTFPEGFARCAGAASQPIDDDASEEEIRYAKAMDDLRALNGREHYCWSWRHPDTCDKAALEHNEKGDWLSFSRLYEDGRMVRTIRRPEGIRPGAPEATGLFIHAPMPGLYKLMVRLGGDTFVLGNTHKPGVGQFDHTTESLSGLETYETHLANVLAVAIPGRAVPFSPALTLALNRRTLHVLETAMGRASWLGNLWMFGGGAMGRIGAAALAVGATGSWLGLLMLMVARQVTGPLWGFSTGCGPFRPILVGMVLFAVVAAGIGLSPAAAAVVLGVDGVCFCTTRLIYFYLGQAGRTRLDFGLTEPEAVPASELISVYGGH